MPRYLTKSRFKLALECPTKLYYNSHPELYKNQLSEDSFLMSLADGGYQVNELAKYLFCEDPVGSEITIEERDHAAAITETNKRIARGDAVIAEAAFLYDKYFIRADMVCFKGDAIELYEVKAKSFTNSDTFITTWGNNGVEKVRSEWEPYIYDVAFQTWVIGKCFPQARVEPHLILVSKDRECSEEGLNQKFTIQRKGSSVTIHVDENYRGTLAARELLAVVPMDHLVDILLNSLINPRIRDEHFGLSFENFIERMAVAYENDQRIPSQLSTECKKCQFCVKNNDTQETLADGRMECWKEVSGRTEAELRREIVTDIWALHANSLTKNLIQERKYLLSDIPEDYEFSNSVEKLDQVGLSKNARRALQIEKVRDNDSEPFIDIEGLQAEMRTWKWPLHFIDFETATPALPFHAGNRPYELLAFQYSHHIVAKTDDGGYSVEHKGECLFVEPKSHPNVDFVRALMKELSQDDGTVFRYHNHENSTLNTIYKQISAILRSEVPDKDELLAFIESITHVNAKKDIVGRRGDRDMIDLYDLVIRYYYPPTARGSNSIKAILPATILASEFLREKYSKPAYGSAATCAVKGTNFKEHVWIDAAHNNDPYKTLPRVFENIDNETLDEYVSQLDQLADGGAATMAYARLQFEELSIDVRAAIKQALLKYCELDTMAMVMIVEEWFQKTGVL